jgi:hypothetical protein
VEAGEAQLHLRLDPERADDSEIICGSDGPVEERGFSDAGLAAKNERSAESVADGVEEAAERRLLAGAID